MKTVKILLEERFIKVYSYKQIGGGYLTQYVLSDKEPNDPKMREEPSVTGVFIDGRFFEIPKESKDAFALQSKGNRITNVQSRTPSKEEVDRANLKHGSDFEASRKSSRLAQR